MKSLSDETNLHAEIVKELGIFGLRTLVLINSGAAVVLLAFLGNAIQVEVSRFDVDLNLIKRAMIAFVAGIALAMLSVMATYVLAQISIARGNSEKQRALWFVAIMTGPAVLSFLSFAGGVFLAVSAVSQA